MVLCLIHFNRCIVPLCDIVVQLLSSKRESYAAVYIYPSVVNPRCEFCKIAKLPRFGCVASPLILCTQLNATSRYYLYKLPDRQFLFWKRLSKINLLSMT